MNKLITDHEQLGLDRPLKVMFILTSMPVGGAETLLVNLIDRLEPARLQAEVICLKEAGPLGEQLAARIPVHANLLKHKRDVSIVWRLAKLLRQRGADAVITVGSGDKMFWGRLAAKAAGVPVICSALHSTGWPDGIGRLNRLLTPITDGFIAVAESHANFLRHEENLGDARVHMIRNGIDTDRFCPTPIARACVREELGISLDAPVMGIVAALRPEKNHPLFLEVAHKIRQTIPAAQFLIIGDGPCRPAIEQLRAQLGLDSAVHLLGTRMDTPRIVAALDVFTLCSHNEAFPVSILEALSCGVPVVSTDVGSVREAVLENITGFCVPPGDAISLASRVIELLQNPELAAKMGQRGREIVQRTCSLTTMVNGYQNLIEQLYCRKTQS